MTLNEKKCIVCEAGIAPMSSDESALRLKEIDDWNLGDKAKLISKNIEFRNFQQALDFVNKIGAIAEAEKHHPDINFGWGYVNIVIQTHKINGLHENDFILAAKIDNIA